jgi:multiple sugar transport system permease protein
MTQLLPRVTDEPVPPAGPPPPRRRRTRTEPAGGIVSSSDWRRPSVRYMLRAVHFVVLAALIVIGLGPILWLAKAAITPTQDTLRKPLALWPHGMDWANLSTAWSSMHLGRYVWNTVVIAGGSWLSQIVVATTAGYALSVLRPKYGRVLSALVLGTLLVPTVVLLVPLYLTVLNPPLLRHSLLNSFFAVWLPAGANAFNILLVKRFFDNLPREVFEAARADGAGPFRLFWSIVLPMSRPILGVVSVFAIIASWKDFLWPLLVLPDPAKQPLSVRLPTLAGSVELDTLLAALLISTLIPIALFLLVQRLFLRGTNLSGAIKG